MTPAAGAGMNKRCCAAALGRPARQVHLAVLAAFAESSLPPARSELERIAREHGPHPAAVLAELAERDLVAFDDDGEVRAAYPFSPSPTLIKVTWEGGPIAYAMCAIDALGMSAMLGRPVTIAADEPDTGRLVTVHVDSHQARWHPKAAVVFAGTGGEGCHAADRSCGYINFFTGARAARKWARSNPAVTGTALRQADALSTGIAEFQTLMQAENSGLAP